MLIGRPQRHVSAPGLAAGPVEIAAVLREQAQELRSATATDGVRDERALVGVRARLQQQPHVIEPIVVEGVRQRVRPARLGAVLEQQPEAGRVLGLGRVVERLAVVRTRPGVEQDARQLRIMCDPGRAVERRHPAILVAESHVRIRAALEQLAREPRLRGSTSGRRRGAAPIRAALRARSDHPPSRGRGRAPPTGRARSRDARPEAPRRGPSVGRSRQGRRPRRSPRSPRPARASSRTRARVPERQLGVREGDALPHRRVRPNSGERLLVSRPRGAYELLRLLAQLLEIHGNLLPFDPASACSGGKETFAATTVDRGGLCPARGLAAPSRALEG